MQTKLIAVILLLMAGLAGKAQTIVKGRIVDATTHEPVQGATIHCTDAGCNCGCTSDASGAFEIHCTNCSRLAVSAIGYDAGRLDVSKPVEILELAPSASLMQALVVTANRGESAKRSQAPVAIAHIGTAVLQDTKPVTIDQVLNKISGVNMISLGNEQHQMSIRQPMTTKSLFLYLEDGIPVRTTGLFNHNALLEMNMAALKNIEVIKGPSSSLYGSEAIGGVVNFISAAPTVTPVLRLSAQGSSIGYKRTDLQSSFSKGKWGFVLDGYYADKRHGFMDYSDFHKATATARADYRFNARTRISNSITALKYYSDMPSGVDSAMFASHTFINPQTFTYRKVDALRYHSTLTQEWNERSKSTVSVVYRSNTVGQNPNYRIKDDYKKTASGWTGKKDLAHGEINESSFHSYALIAQHKQQFGWKKASVTAGMSIDLSPSTYHAQYIRIKKDTINKKYISYQPTDSTLTDYSTHINNYAAFSNFECSPTQRLRLVASVRYDLFRYGFDNHLKPSSFTGAPDTISRFKRFSPKIGITYSISAHAGFYANYSQGFVPPQVSDLYTGVQVPNLDASIFYNYEAGGWIELLSGKLSADLSAYRLNGTNEVVAVKLNDGSTENRNAGRTEHQGIELGINTTAIKNISIRFSGAYSVHRFKDFVEKGVSYSDHEMNNAPRWTHNAEIWYRPACVKGLRIGAEWQLVGSYFMDPVNTVRYKGYQVLNLRAGYRYRACEIWANLMNATNEYYSYISSKSASGYSYQLAEPRNITIGLSCDLAALKGHAKTQRQ